jgi:DNA ligase 1
MQALQNTTSLTPATMRALYKQYGDPGDVAYHAVVGDSSAHRTSVLRPHPPLLIQALFQELRKIASAKGGGSQKIRQGAIERLMLSAVGSSWKSRKSSSYIDLNPHLLGEEPRYLVRTLVHNLRVGAVRTTILSALARAVTLTPPRESIQSDHSGVCNVNLADLELVKGVLKTQELPTRTQLRKGQPNGKKGQNDEFTMAHERIQAALKGAEIILRRAFAQHPSYDDITTVLLEHGIEGILSSSSVAALTLGTPLLPTLGSPMRSLEDIYDLLGPQASWCAERKYDGQRAQVHAWRNGDNIQVRIFSRHLENMTDKVMGPPIISN